MAPLEELDGREAVGAMRSPILSYTRWIYLGAVNACLFKAVQSKCQGQEGWRGAGVPAPKRGLQGQMPC